MPKLRLGIVVAGVLLVSVSPVLADGVDGPRFIASDPQAGSELPGAPPERVEITFSEPLDPSSEIKVIDACYRRVDDRSTTVWANRLEVGLKTAPSGTYTVFYAVTGPGGVTGETTGSFQFFVHEGPSCKGKHGGGKHGGRGERGDEEHGGGDDEHEKGSHHEGGGSREGGSSREGEGSGHPSGSGPTHRSSGARIASRAHAPGNSHSGSGGSNHGGSVHAGDDVTHGSLNGSGMAPGSGAVRIATAGSVDQPQSKTLAAPGKNRGERPLVQGQGSAVLMALGGALLMGAGGGWVIRTNDIS